ncbi:MAG: DUF1800 family protein [Acidobacteria bacterium]|nr:DUF1800 family protein [Acidobacteriota bacterium]
MNPPRVFEESRQFEPLPSARTAHRWVQVFALLAGAVLIWNTPTHARQGVTRRAAAHFLEQATFGPTAADVDLVMSSGYDQWLNDQFAMPESPMPDDPDVSDVRNALFLSMVNGPDQLRQRMIFALSQVIVVSANKNNRGNELAPWVRLLSRNAFGNFRTLLREVTLSPTMGKYLDLVVSRCTRNTATCPNGSTTSVPNENYAREVQQLFTIGLWELNQNGTVRLNASGQPIPTYTQATLVEYARAMTGWGYASPTDFSAEMVPVMTTGSTPQPRYHDIGAKTLLSGVVLPASANNTAALYSDIEGVVDSIMAHPNVAPFVSTRLIRSLVTSNPTPSYIQRVATVFSATSGDLRATLTAILTDPEARAFTITDGRLKDPILGIMGLTRALGIPVSNPGNIQWSFSNLLELVLTPSTVFNFYNLLTPLPGNEALFGPEFGIYPPALAVQRANFIYGILYEWYNSIFAMGTVIPTYEALAADPAALVEAVNQNLTFGRMSSELRDLITTATAAITDTSPSGLRERARGALYLAAISSEYSVYSDTSVAGAASVQPPTGLAVSALTGNTVSISWRAPLIGPAPTGYVLEGGVRPGEVLATIPIGSTTPTYSFQLPSGAYYLRLRTTAGAAVSRASSEIRIYVGATSGPTAPKSLSAYGRDSSVVLKWVNTFGGGEPFGMAVDVTQSGARVASIPLPFADTWSYDAVPPGTYAFTVRATNGVGTSGSSNSITLTFPLSGCSSPRSPEAFSFAANGRTVSAYWLAPSTGTTPTRYTVEARLRNPNTPIIALGSFVVTATTLSSPVGPGRYEVRVRSENICGNSSFTGWQSVTVP